MNIEQLLDVTVAGLGYELVAWERVSGKGMLRVYIDKPAGINVDDCAQVSEHLSRVFAAENVDYGRLEVSSPGLDRVLRTERDFLRFVGEKIRAKLRIGIAGQRNFIGQLRAVRAGQLEIEVDGRVMTMEINNIEKARLVPKV